MHNLDNKLSGHLAYIIGVAIGDGNLSNPTGRSVRLRISCNTEYQEIIKEISSSLKIILPKNKVSYIKRKCKCLDISSYSKNWEKWLGWKFDKGPKHKQNINIPEWIKIDPKYSKSCLKGLFQTDGSIYHDRGYIMANFVTTIPKLADEIVEMIKRLGFRPKLYTLSARDKMRHRKYTIRISIDAANFIKAIGFRKDKKII